MGNNNNKKNSWAQRARTRSWAMEVDCAHVGLLAVCGVEHCVCVCVNDGDDDGDKHGDDDEEHGDDDHDSHGDDDDDNSDKR